MLRSLYTASTGMSALQLQIDVTSNNISNVNTYGYKKHRAEFRDCYYQALEYAGSATSSTTRTPTGIEVGLGASASSVTKMFLQGNAKETGNNLDVAVAGSGFFQIQLPDGTTAYTRNGAFKLDGDGNLVTADGYQLIPTITLPQDVTQISIGKDGVVSVLQGGQTELTQVGQIELANFINPAGLHSLGSNLYINTTASGNAIVGTPGLNGIGQLKQSCLEMSNVQLVEEMTDLITGQRAYEANSKSIQTADSMLQVVNGLKR